MYTAVIVVGDIVLNHGNKFFAACESFAIISFSLEDFSEAFHRSVVDALGYSGHTLLHLCFLQFVVEDPVCVLKTSVAVKQGMCV